MGRWSTSRGHRSRFLSTSCTPLRTATAFYYFVQWCCVLYAGRSIILSDNAVTGQFPPGITSLPALRSVMPARSQQLPPTVLRTCVDFVLQGVGFALQCIDWHAACLAFDTCFATVCALQPFWNLHCNATLSVYLYVFVVHAACSTCTTTSSTALCPQSGAV